MSLVSEPDPLLAPADPKPGRVKGIRTWLGLFGAPAAWIAQLAFSEPLVAHACYPDRKPLAAPIWNNLPTILAVSGVACLLVALLSGYVAWTSWRQAGRNGIASNACAFESNKGRTAFLAKLSLMSSFLFIVAILFNLCAMLLVPLCSSWF